MSSRRARAVTYGVIALLACVVIRATDGRSDQERPHAREGDDVSATADSIAGAALATSAEQEDTLGRGESLGAVLARGGMSRVVVNEVLRAASMLDMRRIPAGMRVVTRTAHPDSTPSEVVLHLSVDRLVRLQRTGDGWAGMEERTPWRTDTVVVAGVISSSLYEAMQKASRGTLSVAASQQLTWTLADVYEYRVDMSKDLKVGDHFRVLAERSVSPAGATRMGKVLAASLTLSGSELQAIRFERGNRGEYYDAQGKSLRAAFLRAPLEFRRISSSFGFRRHPILGDVRKHKGTDYAASSGTPVRAIGDGVVQRAGWGGGYGNVLEIRHPNGFVSRYAHLSRFAKGLRLGTRVAIGQQVAFVGSTGLSTAPHLHFEVLVGGVQRDPGTALRDRSGLPIAASERSAFDARRGELLAALNGEGATIATADGQGTTPAN